MLGKPGGSVARVWPVFAPVEVLVRQQQRSHCSRGVASAPGCPQHGLIHWDELPGSVQHESIAADRGFCSIQKV